MRGFTPDRRDLFDRARATFALAQQAIEAYRRDMSAIVQNTGMLVDDSVLTQMYDLYVTRRQNVLTALAADVGFADQLFAETQQAILATDGQPPPPVMPFVVEEAPPAAAVPPEPVDYDMTQAKPKHPRRQSDGDTIEPGDCNSAIALIDATLEMLDEIPEEGEEFAVSVGAKLRNMRQSIEERGRFTERMQTAIENMHRGAVRWIEKDRD